MIATDTEITHFLKVYQHRHFTRASIDLGISQPALTQSLARLEGKLKTNLFIRSKRGCQPTPAADVLFQKANRLKECWDEISQGVQFTRESLSGKFRLGCHASIGAFTLPNFFKTLNSDAPLIEVSLIHDLSRKITEQVIQFELDVGIVVNPEKHADLVIKKLATDEIGFWGRSASAKTPKIVFSEYTSHEVQRLLKGKAKAFADWKWVQTQSLELIRTLANQGAGIGILPGRVAQADSSALKKMSDLVLQQDEICMIYRVDTLRGAAGKALTNALKSCIMD